MKNYLFAPFKDDDEKIEEFNAVIRGLNYEVSDVNPSLTDAEVNHYHESALHGLRVFIGRLESYYDVIIQEVKESSSKFLREDSSKIQELKAEIKELMILKDDKKRLNHELRNKLADARAEIKEKEKQYHMLASSKTSNYPKEYKQEAEEYFEHNPKAKYIGFYMLNECDIKEGEQGDLCIMEDDAIAIIHNGNL